MSKVTMCDACNKIIPKPEDFLKPDYSSIIEIGGIMSARFELCELCTKPIRAVLDEKGLETRNPIQRIDEDIFEDIDDICDDD